VLIAVCVLQFLQTMCTLFLPTLNAKIINNGILTGDNAYILRVGALMLVITLVQICFAVGAVYYVARRWASGDVRGNLFHSVTGSRAGVGSSVHRR
jgi:ATP-binding cassette subfamily B protein